MKQFPKLFIPGPTHVSNDILEILSTPQIGHRTPEISELIKRITKRLKRVLYTDNHIYLISHAATGLWEMGLKNCTKKISKLSLNYNKTCCFTFFVFYFTNLFLITPGSP